MSLGGPRPATKFVALAGLIVVTVTWYLWIPAGNSQYAYTWEPLLEEEPCPYCVTSAVDLLLTKTEISHLQTFFNQTLPPGGIILRYKGGIGNQLFQFACSYAMALDNHWPLYFYYVPPPSRKYDPYDRSFVYDHFHIPIENLIDNTTRFSLMKHLSDSDLLERNYSDPKWTFHELNGAAYCQSPEFWRNYSSSIATFAMPKVDLLNISAIGSFSKHILATESVAVHIRRGDFTLQHPGFFMPIQFQRRAMRLIIDSLEARGKVPAFFVFSDDIDHTKKKLRDFEERYSIIYVSNKGLTSIEEFYLMLLCKHIIFPNSTFSWWVAYLSMRPDKIVITTTFNPAYWKLFDNSKSAKQFYMKMHGTLYHPKEWIVMNPFAGGMLK